MLVITENRIAFDDPRLLRAVTFLGHGQRYTTWLPVGTYEIGEIEQLAPSWDSTEWVEARALFGVGPKNRGKWYIGEKLFQEHIGA